MSTIQIDPRTSYTEAARLSLPRPFFAAIRWGAVFAGVAVGVSVQLALTLLGLASGLSATDVNQGETVGAGPLIWAAISMLIAAFVGSYVAARMSGLKRKVDGMLHGAVSWAVTTLLFAMLATSAGGALLSGVFSDLSPGNKSAAMSPSDTGSSGLGAMVRQFGIHNATPTALQTLQGHIQNGRRDEAIRYMVSSMGVEQTRAATMVDQMLIFSGSPEAASAQGRASADRAVHAASTAAWTAFFAVVLSLALAVAGGSLGATTARRDSWAGGSGAGSVSTGPDARSSRATTTATTTEVPVRSSAYPGQDAGF